MQLGKNVSESVNTDYKWEDCPMCKQGTIFDSPTSSFITCGLCKGKGWIFTEKLCACGAPVTTISADQLLYCGRKECLVDVRIDKREESYQNYNRGTSHGWPDPDQWAD